MAATTKFLGLSLREPLSYQEYQSGGIIYDHCVNFQLLDQEAELVDARLRALEALSGLAGTPTLDGGTF